MYLKKMEVILILKFILLILYSFHTVTITTDKTAAVTGPIHSFGLFQTHLPMRTAALRIVKNVYENNVERVLQANKIELRKRELPKMQ